LQAVRTPLIRYLCLTLCLALAVGSASGCRTKPSGGGGKTAAENSGVLKGPGIDLKRVGIGLPTDALDFTGIDGAALAGAKDSGDVFFGVTTGDNTRIYRRNLERNERTYITELTRLAPGTLATTPDGTALTYCRLRPSKDVIDNPKLTYPPDLAVPYIFTVADRKERRLFDFNGEDMQGWRSASLAPFISPDGKRICVLAYDTNRLLLHQEAREWLDLEEQLRKGKVKKDEQTGTKELLEAVVKSADMRDKLTQAGVTVDDAKPISDAVRNAMKQFKADSAQPHIALLVWEDGTGRVLPLAAEQGFEEHFHYIAALGNKTVVVGAQGMESSPYAEQPLYTCDLETGKLRRFGSIQGLSKLVTLNTEETELRICYSPVREKAIVPESFLLRLPLDGSPTTETTLGGDYLGVVDLDSSGAHMAGQDIVDYNLYLVDTATGKRTVISEQLAALGGLFLVGDASSVAYLQDGVIYRLALGPGAESKRITAGYFAQHKTEIDSFLTKLGFTPPAQGFTYHWEERDGLGTHTVAVELHQTDKPDQAALIRYNVKHNTVQSLWLPDAATYPFAAKPELKGKDYDYYDAEKLAKLALDRSGWMPESERTLYQPGPNPLYDQKSDSYVITFRDSYELKATKERVFSNEATVRVTAKTGKIAEMTFVRVDEVQDQPLKVERSRLPFLVRNVPDQPIPEDAPVKIEESKARLIVFGKQLQSVKDGVYHGEVDYRLCWEVDTYLEPQHDLVFTYILDAETGEKLGSLSYMPMASTATTMDE
jgi:hypothetical protein